METAIRNRFLLHVEDNPSICLGVTPTQEDSLVLIGLARMLNLCILRNNLLNGNSYGFKMSVHEYLDILSARENVTRLF